MIDSENGLVHWTSIWKLLGNSKGTSRSPLLLSERPLTNGRPAPAPTADMVRLVEMQPEVGILLKKVRGGYLKIQGTWLPYDVRPAILRALLTPF